MKEAPSFWRLLAKSLLHIAVAIALGQALLALILALLMPRDAHAEWLPVADTDLSIRPGNALDFSALVEAGPAGKHGRVIANADGHFSFADAKAKRQRFLCASQPWGIEEGFPDHETADRYAQQLRLHGYNLARFHFVENVLMNGRAKDFDFDPEQLDRFYYFMAALKRAGVYWMLDALTSWNGAYGDVTDRWADKHNVKLGVYTDPADQEHWKRMVDRLLAAKNPYTGMSPLQDPALVAVIVVNEGGLNSLLDHQRSAALNREFTQWAAHRYGSAEDASKRWHMSRPIAPLELPQHDWNASERMQDVQRFYFDMQAKTLRWMSEYLRKQGYQGFISGYDNWFTSQDIASRSMLDLVAVHSYHDEPQGFASPGDSIRQTSSLQDELGYIRAMTVSRYWGKPFAVTEYDQPFWNRYRFESGIAMGAYAAFQDWDLICRHASGPIELDYGEHRGARHRILYPYGAGVDPIARASETLAALLFLRGDVRPAKHRVMVRLTPSYVFEKQAGIGFIPPDVNRLGLLTGLGVQWIEGETAYAKNDLMIDPEGVDNTRVGKLMRKVGHMLGQGDDKAQERVEQLKSSDILPKDNDSDAKAGTYESDSGQITLDAGQGVLRVATERTEAMAFDNAPTTSLPHLKILKSSEPALIAASSLDGAALGKSKRILLILATDARNSGMEFADASEKTLRKLGGPPVVIKTTQVHLQLKHDGPEKLKLYALKLNGERGSELPMKRGAKTMDIELNTAKLAQGVTTFFELAGQ